MRVGVCTGVRFRVRVGRSNMSRFMVKVLVRAGLGLGLCRGSD